MRDFIAVPRTAQPAALVRILRPTSRGPQPASAAGGRRPRLRGKYKPIPLAEGHAVIRPMQNGLIPKSLDKPGFELQNKGRATEQGQISWMREL